MSVQAMRESAVQATLETVRAVMQDDTTPSPAQAQCLAAALQALAAREALWNAADFPIEPGALWKARTLHEDRGGGLAMYVVAMHPGHAQPPHDHTTWAVIAGVRGTERNSLYRRPHGDVAAPLAHWGDVTVGPGQALTLGPTDVHALEVLGPGDALHLHLYGRSLAHMPDRRIFDAATGASRPFPAFS